MKLQLTLLSKCLIFLGLISVLFFAFSIYLYNSSEAKLSNEFVCGVVSEPFYCGTQNYETIEHEGYKIVQSNCLTCHSIYKDRYKVGPSLCGTTKKLNERTFNLLLYKDSKNKLPKMKYYKDLVKGTNMEIHTSLKFDFNDIEKENLRSYIDTITVLQE